MDNIYDASARQKFEFDDLADDIVITAVIEPVDDRLYIENYDKKATTKLVDNGQSIVINNGEAMSALFDAVVADVEGIEGEKPENWKELLDSDQFKSPIISRFLAIACYNAPFVWGQTETGVISESYFNNEVSEGRHFLRKKTVQDQKDFRNLQKVPISSKGKGLQAGGDVYLPNFTEKKALIYDRMKTKDAEGYAGGIVPIWHKAAVIDFVFSAGISAKK